MQSQNTMRNEKTVLLGMSGGTDSSVAAILLKEAGYEVTGVTFRFYEKENKTDYLDDAREICSKLNIEHITYDARDMFEKTIIADFIEEYMGGRTPFPCTLCNNRLKWPLLTRIADERGIAYVSMGHYVNKELIDGYWHITTGADHDKDQSFFLWGLKQDTISRMVLPMGRLTKNEVREIARQKGFLKAATKKDSTSICFCSGDYRSFLKEHVEKSRFEPGYYYDETGKLLGKHQGFPFYTIGQRRGLGIYLNKALFVKDIVQEENKVILSYDIKSLEKNEIWLTSWNIANLDSTLNNEEIILKIRYRKQANHCIISITTDGMLHIRLLEPLASVANGQAAVFYKGNIVMGGGIICQSR